MLKSEAICRLGGTVSSAAALVGVTYQAVDRWPDVLPPRIADRVQAALWRQNQAHGGAHQGASPCIDAAPADQGGPSTSGAPA